MPPELELENLHLFAIVVEIELVPALSSFVNRSSGRVENTEIELKTHILKNNMADT